MTWNVAAITSFMIIGAFSSARAEDRIRFAKGNPPSNAQLAELTSDEWKDAAKAADINISNKLTDLGNADVKGDDSVYHDISKDLFSKAVDAVLSVKGNHDYPIAAIGAGVGLEINPKIIVSLFNILPQLKTIPVMAGGQISANLTLVPVYNPEGGKDIYVALNEFDGVNIGLNGQGSQIFGSAFAILNMFEQGANGREFKAKSPKDLYGAYYGMEGEIKSINFGGTAISVELSGYGKWSGEKKPDTILIQISVVKEDNGRLSIQGERLVLSPYVGLQVVKDSSSAYNDYIVNGKYSPSRVLGDMMGGVYNWFRSSSPTEAEKN